LRFSSVPSDILLCAWENAGRKSFSRHEKDRDSITVELQRVLDDEFKLWYPLSIDTTDGGYFSDINYKWELDGVQNKMIVTQARHIWSASNAAIFYQKDNYLRTVAAHGVEFLKKKCGP